MVCEVSQYRLAEKSFIKKTKLKFGIFNFYVLHLRPVKTKKVQHITLTYCSISLNMQGAFNRFDVWILSPRKM
jgi:hypothetical protein